ncbi:MAG: acyl-CoA thioesterase [Planctomycetota bacterium]
MGFPDSISINSQTIRVQPRYAETDQGGVAHHSVYPIWFEMGRTELLRANGIAYKDIEEAGIFFVVSELHIKYRQGAYYDEELELATTCSKVTIGWVEHTYKLKLGRDNVIVAEGSTYKLKRGRDNVIVAQGSTVLACLDKEGKVQKIPEFMHTSH